MNMLGLPTKEIAQAALQTQATLRNADKTLENLNVALCDVRALVGHLTGIAADLHALTATLRAIAAGAHREDR